MSQMTVPESILRAVRADAARVERQRILSMLNDQSIADRRMAGTGRGAGNTNVAKRAAHLDYAAGLISAKGSMWAGETAGEHVLTVENHCDSIDVAWYDPDRDGEPDWEQEPLPVRLIVNDGADNTQATAYISLEDAEVLAMGIAALCQTIHERRDAREAANG